VEATDASVLGGNNNTVSGAKSAVLSGYLNNSSGLESSIVSGIRNITSAGAIRSAVLSGTDNVIEDDAWSSSIGAGYRNSNAGDRSAILMGTDNIIGANALNTVVAGVKASSNHKNSFVFNSSLANPLATTKNGQFLVNATGGVVLNGGTTIQGPLTVSGGLSYEGGDGEPITVEGPQGPAGQDGVDGADGINGVDGEQGPAGPQGPAGAVDVGIASASINVDGDLILTLTNSSTINAGSVRDLSNFSWQQISVDFDSENSGNLYISADGNTVAFNYGISTASSTRIFRYNGSRWEQLGSDIDAFIVSSISADGNTLLFGGIQQRVYRYDGSSWEQLGADFGYGTYRSRISADGNTLLVGGAQQRVYRYDGSSWEQLGADFGDGTEGGESISADGNTVAFSSINYARVYRYNGSNWEQLGADIQNNGGFYVGYIGGISADGNTVAFGRESIAGSTPYTRVMRYNGESWTPLGVDLDNWLVDSISADGNAIAVTGYNVARVYRYNGTWQQQGADMSVANDYYISGASISADGSVVAVSAVSSDGPENNSRYMRVYELTQEP
jgi:hypothetical protein